MNLRYLYLTNERGEDVRYCKIITVVLLLCILLFFCSCHIEESYKEFFIPEISGFEANHYVSSSKLTFARVNNITLIPEIKEISHGEYIIYLSAYSMEKYENIMIHKVELVTNNRTVFDYAPSQQIEAIPNQDGIYSGTIVCGEFTEKDIEIADGKQLDLFVQVQTNEVEVPTEISYAIIVKTYKALVTPV